MEHAISKALILLIVMMSPASAFMATGSAEDEKEVMIDPREVGVEVLLNAPGLSFDLSTLEALMGSGEVTMPEVSLPVTGEEETFSPVSTDTYLMRSASDPMLGVVIRAEDISDLLLSQGYDNPMKGLSISIVMPGAPVVIERELTRYSLTFNCSGLIEGSHRNEIELLNFTDISEYSEVGYYFLDFMYNTSELSLTIISKGTDMSDVILDLNVYDGLLDDALRSKVSSVMGMFDTGVDFWSSSDVSEQIDRHTMVRVDPAIDPTGMDWGHNIKEDLLHLAEIGLVSGLTKEDIISISSGCKAGTLGPERRIFYHYETMEWKTYNSTGLPPLLFGSLGDDLTFGDEEFPLLSGAEEQDGPLVSGRLIALITAGIASLLLGALLYQRVDRAVRLNNARRKLIYERIRISPGIHFSALMKDLDIKPGVTSYHINWLEKEEMIKSFQDGMYRRFYLYDERVENRIMLSDLQQIIIQTINDEPGISQMDISRMIGRSKMVINYHVRFLRDLGLLVLEREGRQTHCFLTDQGILVSEA